MPGGEGSSNKTPSVPLAAAESSTPMANAAGPEHLAEDLTLPAASQPGISPPKPTHAPATPTFNGPTFNGPTGPGSPTVVHQGQGRAGPGQSTGRQSQDKEQHSHAGHASGLAAALGGAGSSLGRLQQLGNKLKFKKKQATFGRPLAVSGPTAISAPGMETGSQTNSMTGPMSDSEPTQVTPVHRMSAPQQVPPTPGPGTSSKRNLGPSVASTANDSSGAGAPGGLVVGGAGPGASAVAKSRASAAGVGDGSVCGGLERLPGSMQVAQSASGGISATGPLAAAVAAAAAGPLGSAVGCNGGVRSDTLRASNPSKTTEFNPSTTHPMNPFSYLTTPFTLPFRAMANTVAKSKAGASMAKCASNQFAVALSMHLT